VPLTAGPNICPSAECIEAGRGTDDTIIFRIEGVVSTATRAEFEKFVLGVKNGEFDDLTR
jgi:ribosomal protein L27